MMAMLLCWREKQIINTEGLVYHPDTCRKIMEASRHKLSMKTKEDKKED